MKKNSVTRKVFAGHNEKYNIDFKYVEAMFSGYTCEFLYDGKKYGFTVRDSFRKEVVDDACAKGMIKVVEIPSIECVDKALESYVDYLIFNEEEKKKRKRYDKINVKNYYLLSISNKEHCYFYDTEVGNKDLGIESYTHTGITSTYYIVNYYDKNNHVYGFSYSLGFMKLEFDGMPGYRGVYFRNVGNECMFLDFGNVIMFIRPGEQLKYCEKNFVKEKIPIPMPVGGKEIKEFNFFDKDIV